MKVVVAYESEYGNTEAIAKAIASAIQGEVRVLRSRELADSLAGTGLLIAGAPTYGGKMMPPMQESLDRLPAGSLNGVKTASFDTRLTSRFARVFGYAAPKIDALLAAKGGQQTVPPEGFLVKKTKGPLLEGELERAAAWGKTISDKIASV